MSSKRKSAKKKSVRRTRVNETLIKNPTVLEMQEPIYRLAFFQAILGPILTLASISCMFFYNISKSSHEEALKSLEIEKD